MIKITKLVVIG